MKSKPYWKMNPTELSNATGPFDKPFIVDESRSLTSAEQFEISVHFTRSPR
jgi:hypothetical protein